MINAVITRLADEIDELERRTFGAGEFAALRRKGGAPSQTPCAHVLPLGLTSRPADAMAGAFTQPLQESIGVILTVRDQSALAKRVLADLGGFVRRIIEAIAGWAPQDAMGVFSFVRAQLVSEDRGTFMFQIDFSINDQLRIIP